MIQPGAVIGGRFRVDRVLGQGGMGVVVAATHMELGQQVALKVLHDELTTNPMIVARFLREARAVAQLRTEHVCRVFDVGRLDNGAPFIVMEMLDGSDLASVVVRGPVPMVIAVEYVIQACVALAEAHAAGLVHRDIKPPNLFVVRRPDGGPLVKVLDFGIAKAATAAEAKLTHTTSTMGSPGYMSPEQIRSTRDVDARTDIWALGVTLYQLLTGRMPFGGTQLAEIAVSVMTAAPAPLEVDPGLRAVVMRCLEKEPERRFSTVTELATALMPYGGPSAPRFVRETMPRTNPETAPPPMVAVTAPTAASMAMMPPHAHHGPPQHGVTAPAPPAKASGSGKWVAIGVALVVLLVGGGALAGWLARGTSKPAGDAGVVAIADAGIVAADGPSAPIAAIDAGAAADPWNDPTPRTEDPVVPESDGGSDGELDPSTEAMVRSQMQAARNMMSPEQKKQLLDQMTMMEKQLDLIRKNTPAETYQEQLAGFTQAACYVGDAAMSQRFFDRMDAGNSSRAAVKLACSRLAVPLTDKSAPKKK